MTDFLYPQEEIDRQLDELDAAEEADRVAEFNMAMIEKADRWVPGCGGKEAPSLIEGTRYLYCYNPGQARHAYINMNTDMEVEYQDLPRCLRGG